MNDSRPSCSNATHPLSTRTVPQPRSSTLQRVRAPEVDRGGRRRVDEEQPRRRPDQRANLPVVERHAVLAGARRDQPDAAVRLDVHDADRSRRRCRARDTPSVVMTSPTGSRDGASIARAGDRRRAGQRLHRPSRRDRIANANHAAPATRTSDAAAARTCIAACTAKRRGAHGARAAAGAAARRVAVAARAALRGGRPPHRARRSRPRDSRRCASLVRHRSSFSRSIFMPRCRFTRTDPGVRPVRSAISGPGQSFHEAQDQRLAIGVGQRADRRQRDVGVGLAGRGARATRGCREARRSPRSRRWKSVARLRAIIAIQPPNAAGIAQVVEPPPRRQKDVLDEIVHVVARRPASSSRRGPRARIARTGGEGGLVPWSACS